MTPEYATKRYDAFVGHYGMDASRNNRGEAHENEAVESQSRHLKIAIDQALILRGSRDFACAEDNRRFVDMLVARRNKQRFAAVQAEQTHLKPLPQRRTTDFTEIVAPVTRTGGFGTKLGFITDHAGATLTLSRPMPDLAAAIATPDLDPDTGEPLPVLADIAPGCDLRAATCATKFGNLANFGGFPEIPGRNPFGGSSIV
jgi:hypothetical protein